jgi:Trypsin-like peptidase domain
MVQAIRPKVVGADPKTDLALIKVDGKDDFSFVKFAEHAPRVGDWVIAVGNPFGLGGTVTAGIVSARGRDIGAGPYDDYVQIDAPINKGNSGGPAFDVECRLQPSQLIYVFVAVVWERGRIMAAQKWKSFAILLAGAIAMVLIVAFIVLWDSLAGHVLSQ